jgi:hypothetical protein
MIGYSFMYSRGKFQRAHEMVFFMCSRGRIQIANERNLLHVVKGKNPECK